MTTKTLWLVLISLPQLHAAANAFQRTVGIYHWGSQYPTSVSQGVRQIAALGGHIARIALSARSYVDYQMASACYPNFSLTSFAQEPDIKAALDNPDIDVYMLTAYDGTSFSDCIHQNFLVPAFYTSDAQSKMVDEYAEFTLYLYRTYVKTHKRFIISNWEGDNSIYCGSANSYAVDQQFQAYCNSIYARSYGGNQSPNDSIAGLKFWFEARQQGVAKGRQMAAALGIGGTRVLVAPEFCVINVLRNQGLKSVLYDVLPFTSFDYVSYSSYESINQADPVAALIADLNTIRDVVGSTAIIIGESGFARSQWGDQAVARTSEVINAALSFGTPYLFQWGLYDQSASNTFGLFDTNGNGTALGAYFQQNFLQSLESTRPAIIGDAIK
jgi:hypothetical protein